MEQKSSIRPKQYTHINYTALLIYMMKNRVSMEQAMLDNGLNIAKSTVTRNLRKIEKDLKEGEEEFEIIQLYKNEYLANVQKVKFPERIKEKIENLPNREVIEKDELEDLYKKLSTMYCIFETCGRNMEKAVQAINTGMTPLGKMTITVPGFAKNMKRYEIVKEEIQKRKKEKGLRERE